MNAVKYYITTVLVKIRDISFPNLIILQIDINDI